MLFLYQNIIPEETILEISDKGSEIVEIKNERYAVSRKAESGRKISIQDINHYYTQTAYFDTNDMEKAYTISNDEKRSNGLFERTSDYTPMKVGDVVRKVTEKSDTYYQLINVGFLELFSMDYSSE